MSNGELMEPRMSISGAQTPDVGAGDDEVGKFESAKQKKTSLLEGIKKFNFKPKRVSSRAILEILSCSCV